MNAHLHLIATVFVSRPPLTVEAGETFLRDIVETVGMEILLDAQVIYCEDLGNEGVTGIVGLTTSHASFHSWHLAARPFVSFDLYSCRSFNPNRVLEVLDQHFGLEEARWMLIDRADGLNEIVA